LRHTPTSDVLHGCFAELLHYQGEHQEALSHLRQALKCDPRYKWGWNKLQDWGTRDECLEICRSLTVERPGEAHSWRILADNLESFKDLPEKLQALDRAITLEPQDTDAYDSKALALAENKRFDEALAVCRPLAWGGHVPRALRGRLAWIENERGNRKVAIEMMEKVVSDDSTYYWGWSRLSDWLLVENRVPEAVKAADHMVQLSPGTAMAFGYRADAKIRQGNRLGALEDLRSAHVLDPEYGYATWTLFNLIMDDEEYEEAKNLLEGAKRFSNPSKILAAEIRLELVQKHITEALNKLKTFGASTEVTVDTLQDIQKEFQKNEVLGHFDTALDEMISSKTASGPALHIWARRKGARGQWNVGPVIEYYLQHDRAAARFLVDGYLNALGDKDHFEPYALELYRQHRAWIIESTYSWGLMGFALNCARKYEWCANWMADWKEREGTQRWMLIHLTHRHPTG
jgi:tetratricopeptide (TPR) repeat protein